MSPFLSSSTYQILYEKGHRLRKAVALILGFWKRVFLFRVIPSYDIIFIQREAFPLGPPFFEKALRQMSKRIIYDFDDAIFYPSVSPENRFIRFLKSPEKTGKIIKLSDLVIAGNDYLAQYAKGFNHRVEILPTPVDVEKYKPGIKKNSEPIVIGWIGSKTTSAFLKDVEDPLRKVLKRFGKKVKIKIVGGGGFKFKSLSAEYKEWSLDEEVEDLQSFDIGIMPLPDNPWTRGKCGFKALQYMSVGIPALCSAVGITCEIIKDGVNGFLIRSRGEWVSKLSRLIEDDQLRKKMGQAGRKWVEERYSLAAYAQRFLALLRKIEGYQS